MCVMISGSFVFRIARKIVDVNDLPFEQRAPGDRATVWDKRQPPHESI